MTLSAASLWAIGQVAWRYGEGNAIALAGQRSLVGCVFMLPVLVRAFHDGRLRQMCTNRSAAIAVVSSALTMPFTATLFRELTGPQAALMTAVTPAAVMLCATSIGSRLSTRAAFAVVISTVAAVVAALSGGLGNFSYVGLFAAAVLLVTNVVMMLATERAREHFDASSLVAAGMLLACAGCYGVALVVHPAGGIATSGAIAATVAGITGTIARVARAVTLPFIGSAVASSAAQLTALLTAIGGVLLFDDPASFTALALGIVAAAAAVIAVWLMGERPRDVQNTDPK